MAPDEQADLDCLRRHLAGDREAFGELLARHRGRMWAVALRTSGNPEDAADALQDAALSAFRAAGNFRRDSSVGTWLYRITVNACLDRRRRAAVRPTVHYPDPESPVWREAVTDPVDMAEQRDLRLVLEQALATLPLEQRAAVVLVDVQGLPVEEAARVLGVPSGTVKSRCARGRAKLAGILRDSGIPPRRGNPSPDRDVSVQINPRTAAPVESTAAPENRERGAR
ncbi:RNA polymerase sigma factor SigM [Actinospica durhamensis]|uniref:RNA polymerase sigma factor SigM n=1 Tax=Actinospica durhamensis TaxID=1508375 RepID=A0A941EUW7_9ACTN|nr:RNA polymerase sigma factor SigM [Actinospica durhamensis]MBR7834349.1 RNA polymerase sigma factor SigM [Actinospica durhamensis]